MVRTKSPSRRRASAATTVEPRTNPALDDISRGGAQLHYLARSIAELHDLDLATVVVTVRHQVYGPKMLVRLTLSGRTGAGSRHRYTGMAATLGDAYGDVMRQIHLVKRRALDVHDQRGTAEKNQQRLQDKEMERDFREQKRALERASLEAERRRLEESEAKLRATSADAAPAS